MRDAFGATSRCTVAAIQTRRPGSSALMNGTLDAFLAHGKMCSMPHATVARFVLALDQGTTSSRAILFDHAGNAVASAQREFTQHFPRPGWGAHDPREIWESQCATIHDALVGAAASGQDIAAVGIANQRETTVLWDRRTG